MQILRLHTGPVDPKHQIWGPAVCVLTSHPVGDSDVGEPLFSTVTERAALLGSNSVHLVSTS